MNKNRDRDRDKTKEEDTKDRNDSKKDWVEVRNRKGDKRSIDEQDDNSSAPHIINQAGARIKAKAPGISSKPGTARRAPKSAAVLITGCSGEFIYAAALKKAREAVSLVDLKIDNTKVRKAVNGGTIIEVMGPDSTKKANALADKLRAVFHDQAKIARPVVEGEIRLVGLDDSVSMAEVAYTVAYYGECSEEEVKVGPIRPMNNGLFTVWAQCPLGAAIKTANNKMVKIGWTQARVILLEARPVQCFKCWRIGHVRFACTFGEDFSRHCFRCGGTEHRAGNCNLPPSCRICLLDGRDPNHRLGSNFCKADRGNNKIRANLATAGPTRLNNASTTESRDAETR